MDDEETTATLPPDHEEQEAILHKKVKDASDTTALHAILDRLNQYKRTPEEEAALKEKLDKLHAKILRVKAQQEAQAKQ